MTVAFRHRRRVLPFRSGDSAVTSQVASALVSGSVLPELVYRQARATFGKDGVAELIYLIGLYCLVSVTLNGFDVPVPESAT
jgi:4-carboxymuconolactone decarboxylase